MAKLLGTTAHALATAAYDDRMYKWRYSVTSPFDFNLENCWQLIVYLLSNMYQTNNYQTEATTVSIIIVAYTYPGNLEYLSSLPLQVL